MTIQTTTWTPDTCTCTVTYTWDDTVAQNLRVHTFQSVVTQGAEHSALPGATLWSTITLENTTKNQIQPLVQQIAPGIDVTTWLQQVTWSFSGSGAARVLTVNFGSLLTSAQKAQLQTVCDTTFGTGKIIIQ